MDRRVLGDVPSEGGESGHRFGNYSERDSALNMRSVTRNVLLFATAVAAVIAFSTIYPMMQYASKSNKNTSTTPNLGRTNHTLTNNVEQNNVSSNCSTHIFSFGHDCTDQYPSSTEDDTNFSSTQIDITTASIKRFDETNTEGINLEIDSNLDGLKDFKFQRTGRSKWPLVSTPYPYYRPSPTVTTENVDGIEFSTQETNIFAIPYDSSSDKSPGSTTTSANFLPPPYVFTAYPNFTGSYAQLSSYKVPQNNSNFIKVMKYLNKNVASERQSSDVQPKIPSLERNTVMKVSGTYIMPLDRRRPGEIMLSSSLDNIEEARPFFNGHAYVSDPFIKYRPINPSDVNRLIPVKSSYDIGPRFRKPVSFVPTSSIAVDIAQPSLNGDKDHKYQNSGSHTVAIFHPPKVVSQKPTWLTTPSNEESKEKPLSVVLDIYPVTVDSETESSYESSRSAGRERGRLNHRWKPKSTERPKWRPQPHSTPAASDEPSTKNHMIVHLNLFPNNRKPYSLIRRSRLESTTEMKTMTLSGDGQFNSRITEETAEPRGVSNGANEFTTKPMNTSNETSALTNEQPEFSALERYNNKEEETTTITDDLQTKFNNYENTIELTNNESNGTTLKPADQSDHKSIASFSLDTIDDGRFKNKSAEMNSTKTEDT